MNVKLTILLRILSFLVVGLILFDFGFDQDKLFQQGINLGYYATIVALLGLQIQLYRTTPAPRPAIVLLDLVLFSIIVGVSVIYWLIHLPEPNVQVLIELKPLLVGGIFLHLGFLLAANVTALYNKFLNPAILFAGSFALIIIIGTLLLLLPEATVGTIGFTDALFTATSAVAVTGLVVLDTGKDFTMFGQIIIMVLIELGGLGILTFTSFFAYFFRGGTSFREGLYLMDMLSTGTLKDVLKFAFKVVVFTLLVQSVGVLFLYCSTAGYAVPGGNRLFFSIFHAISAFCNAGFSTLTAGLYEEPFRYNYFLQWIIAFLLIIGGLGFIIVFNFYTYFRTVIKRLVESRKERTRFSLPVRVITLNSKIVLATTGILILVGTVVIYLLEYKGVLAEHPTFWGKFTTAFFTGVTPRTAGFNTIDFAALGVPALLIIFLLMWIGASPGSTGGGIKTSTFAIATLNILATARGKYKIEIGTRQISEISVQRAFSILSISLIVIGFSIFFISWSEPELDFLSIAFECFSAYSTVGLSLGITAQLSDVSKYVLIVTMFVGRIGTLNLLVGMIRQMRAAHHTYPTEKILIN